MNEKIIKEIIVDSDLCKGCYICIEVCPYKVLDISDTRNRRGILLPTAKNIENCISCKLCEVFCPDFAIEVHIKK